MEKEPITSEVTQLFIILGACVLGEILHTLIPIPISSGVYGMFILFLLLTFRVVKVHQVEKCGNFLTKNMLVMFIPASVGLCEMLPELKTMAIPVILAITVVTILVMVITGKVTQGVIKLRKNKENKE